MLRAYLKFNVSIFYRTEIIPHQSYTLRE